MGNMWNEMTTLLDMQEYFILKRFILKSNSWPGLLPDIINVVLNSEAEHENGVSYHHVL